MKYPSECCSCGDFYGANPIPDMSVTAIIERRRAAQARLFEPGVIQFLRDIDKLLYLLHNEGKSWS